jgi:hypothetical protein
MYGRMEVKLHTFLISTLDEGKSAVLYPAVALLFVSIWYEAQWNQKPMTKIKIPDLT